MSRSDKPKWDADVPVCMHRYWGEVTLCGVDISYVEIFGRQQALVEVWPDRINAKGWAIGKFMLRAWPEDLTPLTVSAQEMFDEAVAQASP